MANNTSLGPVQVMGNSVTEINFALQQVQERIDEIKGLRGRAILYDRVGVSSPTESGDAATLTEVQNPPLADGTAAAPALRFSDDTDTGLYRVGADTLGVSTGGTLRLQVSTTQVQASVALVTLSTFTAHGAISVQATDAKLYAGTGSPEGSVTAEVGSIFLRTDGGTSTTLYVKESGSADTGWVAK